MKTLFCRAIVLGGAIVLHAATFCSLKITVTDDKGNSPNTQVTVQEENGRKFQQRYQNGGIKFCDLGIKPVTVTVGSQWCNQVVVRNVPLEWGEPTNLHVLLDLRACTGESAPVAACQMMFRFADTQGADIGAVSVQFKDPDVGKVVADQYGRVFIRIPAAQSADATATAPGYAPTNLAFPCTSENYRLQRTIVMKAAKP